MDVKLLSRAIAAGDASSRSPPVRATPSKPDAFLVPFGIRIDDVPPSPGNIQTKIAEIVEESTQAVPPFTPYSAQVPWHTGMRALFSQMFPRYGHYCGPNWSSGRSGGSLIWDKPPIDWLDHCCYCHDVGYDSFDQAKLYKADLELLECLQKMPPPKKQKENGEGSANARRENAQGDLAWFYRNIYITGLQSFLIPYRRMLLRDMGGTQPQE